MGARLCVFGFILLYHEHLNFSLCLCLCSKDEAGEGRGWRLCVFGFILLHHNFLCVCVLAGECSGCEAPPPTAARPHSVCPALDFPTCNFFHQCLFEYFNSSSSCLSFFVSTNNFVVSDLQTL